MQNGTLLVYSTSVLHLKWHKYQLPTFSLNSLGLILMTFTLILNKNTELTGITPNLNQFHTHSITVSFTLLKKSLSLSLSLCKSLALVICYCGLPLFGMQSYLHAILHNQSYVQMENCNICLTLQWKSHKEKLFNVCMWHTFYFMAEFGPRNCRNEMKPWYSRQSDLKSVVSNAVILMLSFLT